MTLQRSLVARLVKSVLPEKTAVQKDALTSIQEAATVFISFLYSAYANPITCCLNIRAVLTDSQKCSRWSCQRSSKGDSTKGHHEGFTNDRICDLYSKITGWAWKYELPLCGISSTWVITDEPAVLEVEAEAAKKGGKKAVTTSSDAPALDDDTEPQAKKPRADGKPQVGDESEVDDADEGIDEVDEDPLEEVSGDEVDEEEPQNVEELQDEYDDEPREDVEEEDDEALENDDD